MSAIYCNEIHRHKKGRKGFYNKEGEREKEKKKIAGCHTVDSGCSIIYFIFEK